MNGKYIWDIPFEITVKDFAMIFDELDVGPKTQIRILEHVWKNEKWILQKQYKNKKARFIQDVLYQINYLYNENEIRGSIEEIERDVNEAGHKINVKELTEDYTGVNSYLKRMWVQLNYLTTTGYIRAKLRTVLHKYGYKRRSDLFCEYFIDCLYFYKINPTYRDAVCNIREIPLDTMITFRMLEKRRKYPF